MSSRRCDHAHSSALLIFRPALQSVFPDNEYSADSGGDPKVIPELTFERFQVSAKQCQAQSFKWKLSSLPFVPLCTSMAWSNACQLVLFTVYLFPCFVRNSTPSTTTPATPASGSTATMSQRRDWPWLQVGASVV